MPQTHRQALPKGYMLQEYQVDRVLGAGGFGLTYLGWDTALEKPVAVKEYLPNDLAVRETNHSVVAKSRDDEDNFRWGLTRFLDEARTLARFKHPNIVPVHRCFEAHGTAYIVMEFVEGETFGAYLKRAGKPKESFLRAVLTALLDGLAEVHRAGFMHRDIKPGNILLNAKGVPVLVDFGSARQEIGGRSRSITSVVTPGYAPIEQYSSRGNQGPWTDIYALGAVAYRAITGESPPDATERVRKDPMTPATDAARGKYSAKLLAAVDWALAVDEDKRPQDVDAWRGVLMGDAPVQKPAAVESPVKSEVNRESERKKSSGWAWAAAVAGVLIVGGLVAWESHRQQEAELARQEDARVEAREQAADEKRRAEAAAKREAERRAREQAAKLEAERLAREEAAKRESDRQEAARQKQIEDELRRAAAEQKRRAEEVRQAAIARLTPKCNQPTQRGDADCWHKVANRPDCYVWNGKVLKNERVVWSGQCNNGVADGHGEATWHWSDDGRKRTGTGLYVNGKRHGYWAERFASDGVSFGLVMEGSYKDDKRHGHWVLRFASGGVHEGPYVDGKKHGDWVQRSSYGGVSEGAYKNGKKHGHWIERTGTGSVKKGLYKNDKPHGRWFVNFSWASPFYMCYENGNKIDC